MAHTFAIWTQFLSQLCGLQINLVCLGWKLQKKMACIFYGKERRKVFDTVRGRKNVSDTLHCVKVMNLRPNTPYRYRIFTKEMRTWTWSDWVTYGENSCFYRV